MDSSGALASPKFKAKLSFPVDIHFNGLRFPKCQEHGVSSRKRPLHVCAVSFIAISCRIYTKAHYLNGRIGTMLERIATLVSPVICIAQYLFLAAISFLDDCILASEGIFEFLFPPSSYVFDTIEDLVRITETLPKKFDVLMNKFPTKSHDLVPFLDWVLAHFIARLNFVVYNLATWGLENTMKKEIITFQPDIGNGSDKEKGRVHPNSENISSKEGEIVSLTITPLNTKLSHEEKHIIQPDSENEPHGKDVVTQPVSEKAWPEEKHIIQPNTKIGPRDKDVAAQLVNGKASPEEKRTIQPNSENEPHGKDVAAQSISEKVTPEENHIIQPETKNGSHDKDVATQGVSEQALPEEKHITQPDTKNGPHGKDVAVEPVSENLSPEQKHIIQPYTKNKPLSRDVAAQTVSENALSHEEYVIVESQNGLHEEEGRAGLAIEPIATNQSSEEEDTVCFTVQPSEEYPAFGLTVKPASVGSNIVGLAIQPISRKGSYKEVLERGLTRDIKGLKLGIEHTRVAARVQNGKKNTSNFRRSASYT